MSIREEPDCLHFQAVKYSGILPFHQYRITGINVSNKRITVVNRRRLFNNLHNDSKSPECQSLSSYHSLPNPLFKILYIISMMASFTLYEKYYPDGHYTSKFSLLIFSHLRKLYLNKFNPFQYPQLYCYILSHFIVASNNSNITNNTAIKLLAQAMKCVEIQLKPKSFVVL